MASLAIKQLSVMLFKIIRLFNMEQDRYQQNPQLFITAMVFFILSFSILAFTAYLVPYLLLKWRYDVPGFIVYLEEWLVLTQNVSERMASFIIFLSLMILSAIITAIAYALSNRLENQVIPDENAQAETPPQGLTTETKETISVITKIIIIVVLAFIGLLLFQWFIYIPPTGD